MTMEIVRADSGADAVIWLVLGVFWLIAQGIAKLRGGSRTPPRPPPIIAGDRSIEEDLKTLFEQISGQQQPPPPPPPPPISNPMKPIPYGTDRRLNKQHHPKRKTAGRVEPVQAAYHPESIATERTIEVGDIATLSTAKTRGGMFKESLMSFSAIKTPLPAAKPMGVGMMGTGAHLRQMIKGRKQLKQAMISRIVLGPPKAFGSSDL
jgi:hypothetical protein